MMQIARLRTEHGFPGDDDKPAPPGENRIWNYILENHRRWDTNYVKPLYLTLRGGYGDVSLVVTSKSADDFSDFIMRNLAHLDCLRDIWMFNLMEPRLFTVPKDLSGDFRRFTVALDAIPREAPYIHEAISRIKPAKNILITYVAYTYHRYSDILISLIAKDTEIVEDFNKRYIVPMKGVSQTEVIPIIKSINLASPKEWRDWCYQYFVVRKQEGDEASNRDLEIYEDWFSSGFE